MRSYSSSIKRYLDFCTLISTNPYPASESLLSQFVTYLGKQKLKHQTIKCYLSAVRYFQIISHFPDPFIKDMPRLQYVLRGIKSEQARQCQQSRQRLPVTTDILRKIHKILIQKPTDFDNVMLWSAFLVCFFGFLRSGEVTVPDASSYDAQVHLNFEDVSADDQKSPSILQIRIKASKTDPFRKGVNICIGRTNNPLCPVSALLNYLVIRGNSPGLLFHFKDGTLLTKPRFTQHFRHLLSQAGIDPTSYAGHSFRIGAATTAAARGIEDSLIQTLGRWKSSAYLTYVRLPAQTLAALSHQLTT